MQYNQCLGTMTENISKDIRSKILFIFMSDLFFPLETSFFLGSRIGPKLGDLQNGAIEHLLLLVHRRSI